MCVCKEMPSSQNRENVWKLRATMAISDSTCLSKKKSFATAGMVPTKVRTRWCRAEELRSPEEERKEKEMDRACEGPLTSIYTLKASKLL